MHGKTRPRQAWHHGGRDTLLHFRTHAIPIIAHPPGKNHIVKLIEPIAQWHEDMTAFRRDLHMHPELAVDRVAA